MGLLRLYELYNKTALNIMLNISVEGPTGQGYPRCSRDLWLSPAGLDEVQLHRPAQTPRE